MGAFLRRGQFGLGDRLQEPARTAVVAFLDLEMTGLDPARDQVCEVAVVRARGQALEREFQSLVRPTVRMTAGARRVHQISDEMLAGAPAFSEIAGPLLEIIGDAIVISHNVAHDLEFLHREFGRAGIPWAEELSVDTLLMARRLFAFPKNNLAAVCESLKVPTQGGHRALADARATYQLWHRMLEVLDPGGGMTLGELLELVGALAPNSPLRLAQQRQLKESYRHQRTVWIEYATADARGVELHRREIGIWHLKLPYIQAWCFLREGERVFRLDRVRAVEGGARPYAIPPFQRKI